MADWKVASVRQVFATTDPLHAMVLLEEGQQNTLAESRTTKRGRLQQYSANSNRRLDKGS